MPDLKPTPEAEAIYRRWLTQLNEQFCRHTAFDRRAEIVRDELFQLYLGRPHGGKVNATLVSELGTSVVAESFHAGNITLAAEHDPEANLDPDQYLPRKPLIFFWHMFDRSPLGLNHWLGMRFRCMVGRHIFRHVGKGVSIGHNVQFSRGYTLSIEDNCTIGDDVTLDDLVDLVLPVATNISPGSRFSGDPAPSS